MALEIRSAIRFLIRDLVKADGRFRRIQQWLPCYCFPRLVALIWLIPEVQYFLVDELLEKFLGLSRRLILESDETVGDEFQARLDRTFSQLMQLTTNLRLREQKPSVIYAGAEPLFIWLSEPHPEFYHYELYHVMVKVLGMNQVEDS
jgi:hypothetical protein